MAFCALFATIICVFSQISVMTPLGIPITFQIFAIAIAGYTLGLKLCATSVSIYILLGAVGMPVFSGFRGGAHVLFGATGGYIFGFIAICIFCGLSQKTKKKSFAIALGFIGTAICHIIGIFQFIFISNTSIFASIIATVPIFIKDIVFVVAAYFISEKLKAVTLR